MTLPNILIATDFACGGIVITILNSKQIIWNPRLEGSVGGQEHQCQGTQDLERGQPPIYVGLDS